MPKGVYPRRVPSLADRFWAHVEPCENGCLLWTGTGRSNSYGFLELPGLKHAGLRRKVVEATHVAWFIATGEWPKQINHDCDTPRCVQAGHLYPGTQADNMRDMAVRGRSTRPLHADTVRAIRALAATGLPQREVGAIHGVSQTVVSKIVRRESYQDV